jgi:broad specificity phosphatase PhoE
MAGRIHIVRHGHGRHNVTTNPNPNNPRLRDAGLTIRGELQSVTLGQQFPYMNTIGVILTSPLRRSVHTTLLAFSSIIHERFYLPGEGGIPGGVDLVLDPNLQETDTRVWNSGSTAADLRDEWPNLDFSLLISPWPRKTGLFDPARVNERAASVRSDLWDRINTLATESMRKDIVVVTHGGFMQELTKDSHLELGNGEYKTVGISNSLGNPELS